MCTQLVCLLPSMPSALGCVLCAATCVPDALNAFGTQCVLCGPRRVCACCPHRPAYLQSTLFNSLVENGKAQVRGCRSGAGQECGVAYVDVVVQVRGWAGVRCCIGRCGGAGQGLGRSRGITCRGEVLQAGAGQK